MNARQTEKKVSAIVDEILDEDQENDFGATQTETCPGGCEELDDTPKEETQVSKDRKTPQQCRCGVENSSRFSLRVMEAMRSLQRDVDQPPTSTAEEIADYIQSHYRHNGDLYAQVRTALRQVCSQGFVMELLSNEYHLVGPVVNPIKRNDKDRTIDDESRRRRFLRRSPRDRISPQETFGTSVVDRLEDTEPIFHSTRISTNERDVADRRDREFNADVSDIRDDRRRRETIEMERRDDYAEPIPGPSRRFTLSSGPARNAKKARVENRADETRDDETEEDIDDAEVVPRDNHSRIRPVGRPRVRNQRNERRRNDVQGDEEERMKEEDEEERMEEEDEGERMEEDEDMEEDSAYEEIRARTPRRRPAARERELRRWIRRCRRECERRRER